MPTPSRTITNTRALRSRPIRCEVVSDGALRGNGVLEHQVIGTVDLDDNREAVEILDARIKLASVDQMHADSEMLAPSVVEKHVLNVQQR
jgi:hypothetical protein